MMSRTKRYPKPLNPEAPCECSWCNPAKANSEMRRKRKLETEQYYIPYLTDEDKESIRRNYHND